MKTGVGTSLPFYYHLYADNFQMGLGPSSASCQPSSLPLPTDFLYPCLIPCLCHLKLLFPCVPLMTSLSICHPKQTMSQPGVFPLPPFPVVSPFNNQAPSFLPLKCLLNPSPPLDSHCPDHHSSLPLNYSVASALVCLLPVLSHAIHPLNCIGHQGLSNSSSIGNQ